MNTKQQKEVVKFLKKLGNDFAKKGFNDLKPLIAFFETGHLSPELKTWVAGDISNRGDGKTYSYLYAIMALNIEFGISTYINVAHYTLRQSMYEKMEQISINEPYFQKKIKTTKSTRKFFPIIDAEMITVYINDNNPIFISDINNSQDLKHHSQALSICSLFFYDEFIQDEELYNPREDYDFKEIYESIDRRNDNRFLGTPCVLLAGNAKNLSSPLIFRFDLFERLEEQDINTEITEHGIYTRLRMNKNANKAKNKALDRFFKNNESQVPTYHTTNVLLQKKIKFPNKYLIVKLNKYRIKYYYKDDVFSVSNDDTIKVDYCFTLADLQDEETVRLSRGDYFEETLKYRFDKKKYKFQNSFTINIFDQNETFQIINWKKIARRFMKENKAKPRTIVEQKSSVERSKLWLAKNWGLM